MMSDKWRWKWWWSPSQSWWWARCCWRWWWWPSYSRERDKKFDSLWSSFLLLVHLRGGELLRRRQIGQNWARARNQKWPKSQWPFPPAARFNRTVHYQHRKGLLQPYCATTRVAPNNCSTIDVTQHTQRALTSPAEHSFVRRMPFFCALRYKSVVQGIALDFALVIFDHFLCSQRGHDDTGRRWVLGNGLKIRKRMYFCIIG